MNHLLPVFSYEGEPGWLLLAPKGDPKRTKALRSVAADDRISPERTVKGWWISHGLEDQVRVVLPGDFCPSCAGGVPCGAWDHGALALQEFEPRAPQIVSRDEWDTFVEATLKDFVEQGVGAFRKKAHEAVGAAPGSAKARVVDGVFDSLGAAGTVLGQFFEFLRDEPAMPPPSARPQAPPSMTRARAREILGVGEDATPEQIKRAFVRASLAAHPDRGGTDAAMHAVVEARRVLT